MFQYGCEVRFRDVDGLGHVNNAVYHSFVEQARCHFFKQSGLFDSSNGISTLPLILARTEMDFIKPCFFGDKLVVKTWVSRIGNKSFNMSYEILNDSGEVTVKAMAVVVYYDHKLDKSIPIPSDVVDLLKKHEE